MRIRQRGEDNIIVASKLDVVSITLLLLALQPEVMTREKTTLQKEAAALLYFHLSYVRSNGAK